MSQKIRVTQLFDCADVAKTLVAEGRRQGKPWRIIQGPWTRGGGKAAYYRFRAGAGFWRTREPACGT